MFLNVVVVDVTDDDDDNEDDDVHVSNELRLYATFFFALGR